MNKNRRIVECPTCQTKIDITGIADEIKEEIINLINKRLSR